MSAKFKTGDMVALLSGHYAPPLREGMVGTITRWLGTADCKASFVYNAWEVIIDGRTCAANEKFLKLIPGGAESKKKGEWDLCPWSPYKYKNPVVELSYAEKYPFFEGEEK